MSLYSVRGLERSELGGSHGFPGRLWDRFLRQVYTPSKASCLYYRSGRPVIKKSQRRPGQPWDPPNSSLRSKPRTEYINSTQKSIKTDKVSQCAIPLLLNGSSQRSATRFNLSLYDYYYYYVFLRHLSCWLHGTLKNYYLETVIVVIVVLEDLGDDDIALGSNFEVSKQIVSMSSSPRFSSATTTAQDNIRDFSKMLWFLNTDCFPSIFIPIMYLLRLNIAHIGRHKV